MRWARRVLIQLEVYPNKVAARALFEPLKGVSPQARESEDPVLEGERALAAALEPDLPDQPHVVLRDLGVRQHFVQ